MDTDSLRIPKKQQLVSVWIHPEGQVIGSIFLQLQSSAHQGEEQPVEVLNHPEPFLVLRCDDPDATRFYSKRSIVRAQYKGDDQQQDGNAIVLPCQLHMMDGSLLVGEIRESLPPEHSRLYDYININHESFLKLHVDNDEICLVNKSYIVRVTPREGS